MKLSELFEGIVTKKPLPDDEAAHICADTRQITADTVFFCLKGFARDGHDFAKAALEAGAKYVVTERDIGLGERQIEVSDTH